MVCEGDASVSETVFSGTAKRMYLSLQAQGHQVIPVDASMSKLNRVVAAAVSFSPDRGKWRSKFRYGSAAARLRTSAASKEMGRKPVDVLLQIGASFDPPGHLPYAIYSDWNMALDSVESRAANGKSRDLTTQEIDRIGNDHARRYKEASMIFTISERLRQSFIELYGIPADKVMTAYAGPNFDMELIEEALAAPKPVGPPTVLFIAKEFRRKGGDLVADAFKHVSRIIPETRLVFAGTEKLPSEFEGLNVEHLGLLDKSNPAQLKRLLQAYRAADILVLPSRHDPFPTVIREAMFFGMPCIASDIWAMSEMIVDGETGYLVPNEDSEALANAMVQLLSNAELRSQMGAAARMRAENKFSWDAVGKVLHSGIMAMKR